LTISKGKKNPDVAIGIVCFCFLYKLSLASNNDTTIPLSAPEETKSRVAVKSVMSKHCFFVLFERQT